MHTFRPKLEQLEPRNLLAVSFFESAPVFSAAPVGNSTSPAGEVRLLSTEAIPFAVLTAPKSAVAGQVTEGVPVASGFVLNDVQNASGQTVFNQAAVFLYQPAGGGDTQYGLRFDNAASGQTSFFDLRNLPASNLLWENGALSDPHAWDQILKVSRLYSEIRPDGSVVLHIKGLGILRGEDGGLGQVADFHFALRFAGATAEGEGEAAPDEPISVDVSAFLGLVSIAESRPAESTSAAMLPFIAGPAPVPAYGPMPLVQPVLTFNDGVFGGSHGGGAVQPDAPEPAPEAEEPAEEAPAPKAEQEPEAGQPEEQMPLESPLPGPEAKQLEAEKPTDGPAGEAENAAPCKEQPLPEPHAPEGSVKPEVEVKPAALDAVMAGLSADGFADLCVPELDLSWLGAAQPERYAAPGAKLQDQQEANKAQAQPRVAPVGETVHTEAAGPTQSLSAVFALGAINSPNAVSSVSPRSVGDSLAAGRWFWWRRGLRAVAAGAGVRRFI